MKSRAVIWSALLAAAFVIAAVIMVRFNREPMYEGKSLGYWLDQLPSLHIRENDQIGSIEFAFGLFFSSQSGIPDNSPLKQRMKQALQALDAIGTNALPTLIARLQAKDSRIMVTVKVWVERLNMASFSNYRRGDFQRGQALLAFRYLGTKARPALPELLNLTTNRDTNIQLGAWFALKAAAPEEFHKRKHPPIIEQDSGIR